MKQLISKVVSQKCNSSGNLQRSKLVWAVFENVVLSETLDNLDALEKLSFTFRSSRSQIIFKIGVLNISDYSQENTCVRVSFYNVTLQSFRKICVRTMDDFNFTNFLSDKVMGDASCCCASYCCFHKFAFENSLSQNCYFCLMPPLRNAPATATFAKLFLATSSRKSYCQISLLLVSICFNVSFKRFPLKKGYGTCALQKEQSLLLS